MNQITILFFATLQDKAGINMIKLDVEPGITVRHLKLMLVEKFPNLNGLIDHCLASINHEYRFDDDSILENAEIAFFPPVSGG